MSLPHRALLTLALLAILLAQGACGGGGGGAPGPLPALDTSAIAAQPNDTGLPAGWERGAFMEIYVRGYKDSDGNGSGDLRGVTASLDYLKDLGVTGLWLMPVTQSQDHDHGYAVANYRAIESDYGSLADLDELLREAHARGIGVILDYVMNHSAAQNPAFVNAASGGGNDFRDWYVWQNSKPSGWNVFGADPWRAGGGAYYYAPFWDQMPDWNLKNAAVVAWHEDNLRFWLNRGVDGFRFDAVGSLFENGANAWLDQPQNYTLMSQVQGVVKAYAKRTLVCEAPDDPAGFTAACGSAFAFGHQGDIVAAAKGDAAAIQRIAAWAATAPDGIATMVSNHDSFAGQRLWDQVGGDPAQYRLAAATYLLQPGLPFIYYGEEIGMAGAAALSGDAKLRTPMSWAGDARAGFTTGTPFRGLSANASSFNVAAQSVDPNSLHAFYKAMLGLRRSLPALATGSHSNASVAGAVLSFRRTLGTQHAIVAINYGTIAASATVDGLPASATLPRAFPTGAADMAADAGGRAQIALPAQSLAVFGYGD